MNLTNCFVLLILSMSTTGCMTIVAQVEYWGGNVPPEVPTKMIYAGAVCAVRLVLYGGPCGPNPATTTLGILDFPFSFAVDTALLPLTIAESVQLALASNRTEDAWHSESNRTVQTKEHRH